MQKSCLEMQLQIDDVQKNIDALNQSRELVHSKYVFLSGGAGKKKKIDSKVGSPNNQNRPKQASGKNLIQILKKNGILLVTKILLKSFISGLVNLIVYLKRVETLQFFVQTLTYLILLMHLKKTVFLQGVL